MLQQQNLALLTMFNRHWRLEPKPNKQEGAIIDDLLIILDSSSSAGPNPRIAGASRRRVHAHENQSAAILSDLIRSGLIERASFGAADWSRVAAEALNCLRHMMSNCFTLCLCVCVGARAEARATVAPHNRRLGLLK